MHDLHGSVPIFFPLLKNGKRVFFPNPSSTVYRLHWDFFTKNLLAKLHLEFRLRFSIDVIKFLFPVAIGFIVLSLFRKSCLYFSFLRCLCIWCFINRYICVFFFLSSVIRKELILLDRNSFLKNLRKYQTDDLLF